MQTVIFTHFLFLQKEIQCIFTTQLVYCVISKSAQDNTNKDTPISLALRSLSGVVIFTNLFKLFLSYFHEPTYQILVLAGYFNIIFLNVLTHKNKVISSKFQYFV